ncbi:unnamed protein product, partial [Prunus brigantina]
FGVSRSSKKSFFNDGHREEEEVATPLAMEKSSSSASANKRSGLKIRNTERIWPFWNILSVEIGDPSGLVHAKEKSSRNSSKLSKNQKENNEFKQMEQTCKGNGGIDCENTCEATYITEIVVGLVLVHGFETVCF